MCWFLFHLVRMERFSSFDNATRRAKLETLLRRAEGEPSFWFHQKFTPFMPIRKRAWQKFFRIAKKFLSSSIFLAKKFFRFSNKKIAKNGLRPCTSEPGAESRSVDTDRWVRRHDFFESQKNHDQQTTSTPKAQKSHFRMVKMADWI